MTAQTKPERALQILNEKLAAWPLHTGKASARFLKGSDTDISIGYFAKADSFIAQDATRFALNIMGKDCYLLAIEIVRAERGKGYGNQLYEILTRVAQELGCHRIIQTPSGWVVKDGVKVETRREYLERRGWLPWNKEEVHKELVNQAMAAIDEGIFKDVSTALQANEGKA